MDLDETTLLFRVRKTVLQMLKDRGYIVSEKKLQQTKQEFAQSYNQQRDSLNLLVEKRSTQEEGQEGETNADDTQKLIVFFPDVEKLTMQAVKQIAVKMIDINCFNAIVVVKGANQISKKVLILVCNE